MVRQIIFEAYADAYTYSLFLLSTVNHRSSWSSSFICDNNENVFMKGNQLLPAYIKTYIFKYYKERIEGTRKASQGKTESRHCQYMFKIL
jgi:hypothetical protein